MSNQRGHPDFEGFQGVDGEENLEEVGPQETIDLADDIVELLSSSEIETELAINASFATADGELEGVPTSTPVITPVHSPTWQAAANANSINRLRSVFEPSTSVTVEPHNRTSGSMAPNSPDELKRIANQMVSRIELLIGIASDDVSAATRLFAAGDYDMVAIRTTQTRLNSMYKKLLKYMNEFVKLKVRGEDYSNIHISADSLEFNLEGLIERCEQTVKRLAREDRDVGEPAPVIGAKLIKMTPHPFPEFDGSQDLDIFKTDWELLGANSGLEDAGLLIKLRGSIKGRAREYIGASGLSNLTYDQLWEKLKQRYALPWKKTQNAARKFFALTPPTNDRESVIRYVDAGRDAIDAVQNEHLDPEHIFLNIMLDSLPQSVRIPLAEKLEVACADYRFTKEVFEQQFSRVMNLQDQGASQGAVAMYQAQHEVSTAPQNNSHNNDDSKFRGGHRGGYRGRGRGRGPNDPYKKFCAVCYPERHSHQDCKFDTPEKKRRQLVATGKCQACGTRNYEHGAVCSHRARCIYHPGQVHLTYTCEGPNWTHPGPQVKYPLTGTPPQNLSEVKKNTQSESQSSA